jgi:hypothetical protein
VPRQGQRSGAFVFFSNCPQSTVNCLQRKLLHYPHLTKWGNMVFTFAKVKMGIG